MEEKKPLESWPGSVYVHEHVTIDLSGVKKDEDAKLHSMKAAVEEFSHLRELGVVGVVDVTTRGMGRNPIYVNQVAETAGIRVIHATGYYKEPFLPEEVYRLEEAELAALMVRELRDGIGDTGIRAGVIGEVGSGMERIQPAEKKVMRAAALAHAATGAPISTHTTLGKLGIEQVELWRSWGVDLSRVIIGHMDLSSETEAVLRVLDTGVNIGFDTIGKINYQPEEKRWEMLVEICRRGYVSQVMFSMDITRQSHLRQNGGLGYGYLLTEFVPYLLEKGISREVINRILVENPRQLLKGLLAE